jgi:hypothetical protein
MQREKIVWQQTHQLNIARKRAENLAWEKTKHIHSEALRVWEEEVSKSKADQVPKRDWPMKLKHPLQKNVIGAITEAEIGQCFAEDDGEYVDISFVDENGDVDEQEEE